MSESTAMLPMPAPTENGQNGPELLDQRPNAEGRDLMSGRFLPGNPYGRRGRQPGTGREAALRVLDEVASKAGNRAKLKKALQEEFDANPTRFFRLYVMPLLPKTAFLDVSRDGQPLVKVIAGIDPGRVLGVSQ